MCCARNGVVDLVPVDYVNNMLIAVGWITALNRCVCVCVVYRVNIILHRTSQPVVYNYNTGTMNPLTIATLCKIIIIIYNYSLLCLYLFRLFSNSVIPWESFWWYISTTLHDSLSTCFLVALCSLYYTSHSRISDGFNP